MSTDMMLLMNMKYESPTFVICGPQSLRSFVTAVPQPLSEGTAVSDAGRNGSSFQSAEQPLKHSLPIVRMPSGK